MALQVIDSDERLIDGVSERLGVAQTDQQRSGQPGALRDGDGVNRLVRLTRVVQRFAHHGNDGPQMLARSQFRHYSAVGLVCGELRVHDVRDQLLTRAHDGRRGFVARALNAQDENVTHETIVKRECLGAMEGSFVSANAALKAPLYPCAEQ